MSSDKDWVMMGIRINKETRSIFKDALRRYTHETRQSDDEVFLKLAEKLELGADKASSINASAVFGTL